MTTNNLTYEQKVVELVNVERQKAGLPTLQMDSAISNVARAVLIMCGFSSFVTRIFHSKPFQRGFKCF